MKLSAKKIWRRHRKIWRILLLWAVLSLAILFCWAYSLNDGQGGFGRVNGGSRYTLAADEAQKMVINANGVKVELAGSVDAQEVSAILYGEGYGGQRLNLYQDGETVYVFLCNEVDYLTEDKDAALTLRIIVPKNRFSVISLTAKAALLDIRRLRCDSLNIAIGRGNADLMDLDLKQGNITSSLADLHIFSSSINDLVLKNDSGHTTIERTAIRHMDGNSQTGNIIVTTTQIKGIWQINTQKGDVTIKTRRTPYDLFCQLDSPYGAIAVNYTKYDWDKFIVNETNHCLAVIGEGRHILKITSQKGHIILGNK